MIEKGPGQEAPYSIRQVGIYLVVDTEAGLVLLWDKKTSIFLRLSPEFKVRLRPPATPLPQTHGEAGGVGWERKTDRREAGVGPGWPPGRWGGRPRAVGGGSCGCGTSQSTGRELGVPSRGRRGCRGRRGRRPGPSKGSGLVATSPHLCLRDHKPPRCALSGCSRPSSKDARPRSPSPPACSHVHYLSPAGTVFPHKDTPGGLSLS